MRHLALLRRHDRTAYKVIPVPLSQSIEMENGTREWLLPLLGGDHHLVEFFELRAVLPALLRIMFEGVVIQANEQEARGQETQEPTRIEDAMTRACGGDALCGELLTLFTHWSNDVDALGAHLGVGLAHRQPDGELVFQDGTVDTLLRGGELTIVDVPPAPSPMHYWSGGRWVSAEQDDSTAEPKFDGGEVTCG
jgi:hypothetical protein